MASALKRLSCSSSGCCSTTSASKATLPDATRKVLDAHEGWIVGPTFAGEYPQDDPMRGHPNGFIRRHYKLFANVRPVEAWPQLHPLVPDVNITVLRENTEGLYPDRNMAWGYGEFKPRTANGDEAARSQNRRVDLVMLNAATQQAEEPGAAR